VRTSFSVVLLLAVLAAPLNLWSGRLECCAELESGREKVCPCCGERQQPRTAQCRNACLCDHESVRQAPQPGTDPLLDSEPFPTELREDQRRPCAASCPVGFAEWLPGIIPPLRI